RLSQRTIFPTCPLTVIVPVGEPIHIGVVPPEIVPPFEVASTVICLTGEKASSHCPFLTTTRYSHVPAPLFAFSVKEFVLELGISVHVTSACSFRCQRSTEPTILVISAFNVPIELP